MHIRMLNALEGKSGSMPPVLVLIIESRWYYYHKEGIEARPQRTESKTAKEQLFFPP